MNDVSLRYRLALTGVGPVHFGFAVVRTFITYDDPQSIRAKVQYVKAHHLGGMMFWELSEDRNEELLDVIVRSLH
jgi:chitinase